MIANYNTPGEEIDLSRNDIASYGDDTIGENTEPSLLATTDDEKKKQQPKNDPRIETVTPDNDNGMPGPKSKWVDVSAPPSIIWIIAYCAMIQSGYSI